MNKLLVIFLIVSLFSCSKKYEDKEVFIYFFTKSIKYDLADKNDVYLKKLMLSDSNVVIYHDSTLNVLKPIDDIITELEQIMFSEISEHKSKDIVNQILLKSGLGEKIKMDVNNYCNFASRPGYKIENLALDAMDMTLPLNPDNALIPFEVYYFKNASIFEALTILTLIQIEILHVENGYHLQYLR